MEGGNGMLKKPNPDQICKVLVFFFIYLSFSIPKYAFDVCFFHIKPCVFFVGGIVGRSWGWYGDGGGRGMVHVREGIGFNSI